MRAVALSGRAKQYLTSVLGIDHGPADADAKVGEILSVITHVSVVWTKTARATPPQSALPFVSSIGAELRQNPHRAVDSRDIDSPLLLPSVRIFIQIGHRECSQRWVNDILREKLRIRQVSIHNRECRRGGGREGVTHQQTTVEAM